MSNEKTKEVGVIGQMYEERKSKRLGVLESREEKYKTLLMRDPEGKSFNITYSTFHSSWRKYQGEVVVQTSTQVEEERAEQKKQEQKDTEAVTGKVKSSKPKITTEEKIEKLDSICSVVYHRICDIKHLKVERALKGYISIKYKNLKVMEIWDVTKLEKYSFRTKKEIDDFINTDFEKEHLDKDVMNIRYRVDYDKFDTIFEQMISGVEVFIKSLNKEEEK